MAVDGSGGSGGIPPLLVGRDHLAAAVAVASLSSGSLWLDVTPASFMEFWGWEMAGIKWVSLRRPLGLL